MDKSFNTFRASIRAAVRGLWSGQFDQFDFIDAMYSAIRRGYEQAWRDGAKAVGIDPKERTPEEQVILDEMISFNLSFVVKFADWLVANDQAHEVKIDSAFNRAELWINRYNEVMARAQLMGKNNPKLVWRYGPTEHCRDCLKLNGRVYRAMTWQKYGIRPQSHDLACRGYKCLCRLEMTDLPVTPGRPPALGKKELQGVM